MLSDTASPGQILLTLASSLMQPQEPMLTYGPVHWEELAHTLGQSWTAGGLLVGTDRRLLFLRESDGSPSTLMYCDIHSADVTRRLLSCTLRVMLSDGQTASFYGRKKLLTGIGALAEGRRRAEPPEVIATTVSYEKGNISLTCILCLTGTSLRPRCPGCARPIDTETSAEAIKEFRLSMAELKRAMADPEG